MTCARLRLHTPRLSARVEADTAMSTIARLVASGTATSRADLVRSTGLARSTVSTHLDLLLDSSIIQETESRNGSVQRGRPAQQLALSPTAGVVLVVDMGVHTARLTVADLSQRVLARDEMRVEVQEAPATTLTRIGDGLQRLLTRTRSSRPDARAVVMSLPAPVDVHLGMAVRPPIMPGWDGFPVADVLSERFRCRTLVQNDVNLMALGEARALPPEECPLLFIKVGTGIGGGLVSAEGSLHPGANGAAGDIGHIRVPGADAVVCACGNIGCIEAVASAEALLRRLPSPKGGEAVATAYIETLLRQGDPTATRLVKEAAGLLGEVVATLVHFYNPARVVLGGAITSASDHWLAGVRGVVYQRALPLATRNLTVAHSVLRARAGTAGGIVIGVEQVLSPETVRELL